MPNLDVVLMELGWPLAIALAWLAGECAYRWSGAPRISVYGIVGFGLAQLWPGALASGGSSTVSLLANLGFGLILFEFGYRLNLRWTRVSPWTAAGGLAE